MSTREERTGFLELVPRDVPDNEPETVAVPACIPVEQSPSDPTAEQYLRALEVSGSLDFWDRPEEDIYSDEDGKPA